MKLSKFATLPTGIVQSTEKLRKLILENPDLPMVVLATDEANNGEWSTMFCSVVYAELGEFLDCQQEINDERAFTDRDEFTEEVANMMSYSGDYDDLTDEEFDAKQNEIVAQYDSYWRKCIIVTVSN